LATDPLKQAAPGFPKLDVADRRPGAGSRAGDRRRAADPPPGAARPAARDSGAAL